MASSICGELLRSRPVPNITCGFEDSLGGLESTLQEKHVKASKGGEYIGVEHAC